jgi:hypothetical protein
MADLAGGQVHAASPDTKHDIGTLLAVVDEIGHVFAHTLDRGKCVCVCVCVRAQGEKGCVDSTEKQR